MKSFCPSKDIMDWQDKKLCGRRYMQCTQSAERLNKSYKQESCRQSQSKTLDGYFTLEEIQMADKQPKKFLTSLVTSTQGRFKSQCCCCC